MIYYISFLNSSQAGNKMRFDNFCISSVYQFKRDLIKNLNIKKCDHFDYHLKRLFSNAFTAYSKSRKHLTYDILIYIINNIKYSLDTSGHIRYYTQKHLRNPYFIGVSLDRVLRLIEYGNEVIKPYHLFTKTFNSFRVKIIRRYNTIFI